MNTDPRREAPAFVEFTLKTFPSAKLKKLLEIATRMDDLQLLRWLDYGTKLQRKAVRLTMAMRICEAAA